MLDSTTAVICGLGHSALDEGQGGWLRFQELADVGDEGGGLVDDVVLLGGVHLEGQATHVGVVSFGIPHDRTQRRLSKIGTTLGDMVLGWICGS